MFNFVLVHLIMQRENGCFLDKPQDTSISFLNIILFFTIIYKIYSFFCFTFAAALLSKNLYIKILECSRNYKQKTSS